MPVLVCHHELAGYRLSFHLSLMSCRYFDQNDVCYAYNTGIYKGNILYHYIWIELLLRHLQWIHKMKINQIYQYWQWLSNKPLGRWLFNRLIPIINPYTGALKANIIQIDKGYARLELKDRRAIRNHLNSIHAIALTNLGEFTSGIALISLFTENMRGIPKEINIEFLKKARGYLTAECTTSLPEFATELEHVVVAEIKNTDNEVVAKVRVKWLLGYIKE